jgi:proteasome lid subunit RPN8/RPN11
MAFAVQIPRRIYQEMVAQARAELPNECCGLLAGRILPEGRSPVARIVKRYPLVNAAGSPRGYYSEPFAAFRDMRELGIELIAIYHSHPTSAPVPSRTDIERNLFGSSVVHAIISPQDATAEMRAWRLGESDYHEAEWEIIEEDV